MWVPLSEVMDISQVHEKDPCSSDNIKVDKFSENKKYEKRV